MTPTPDAQSAQASSSTEPTGWRRIFRQLINEARQGATTKEANMHAEPGSTADRR